MLPARLTEVKLLPSPGRALVTINRLENPGSAPGPKAARRICRCTRRNSSEMRLRVRDQSTMPPRSSATASIVGGPCTRSGRSISYGSADDDGNRGSADDDGNRGSAIGAIVVAGGGAGSSEGETRPGLADTGSAVAGGGTKADGARPGRGNGVAE